MGPCSPNISNAPDDKQVALFTPCSWFHITPLKTSGHSTQNQWSTPNSQQRSCGNVKNSSASVMFAMSASIPQSTWVRVTYNLSSNGEPKGSVQIFTHIKHYNMPTTYIGSKQAPSKLGGGDKCSYLSVVSLIQLTVNNTKKQNFDWTILFF